MLYYKMEESNIQEVITEVEEVDESPVHKREGHYNSWGFTIRPLKGITDKTATKVLLWLDKQDYGFACLEMEGEARHLHGQIWINEPRTKGTINKSLENICSRTIEDWNPAQNIVLRRGTKIAYNDDFVEEYLSKEDNIIFNNPPNLSTPYYPSQEEQQEVQAKSSSRNLVYYELKKEWKKFNEHNAFTLEDVAKWLMDKMYKYDTYRIIEDDKRRKQFTKSLYYYLKEQGSLRMMLTEEDYLKTTQHYNQMLMEQKI